MKKFDILRYLKQFSLLIVILAVAGAVAIYKYGKMHQSYVATAVIRYTNDGASDGYTPNGKPIQVEEIYCSAVINDAIADLQLRDTLDSIRSRFNVTEVIPDEQQRINNALIEKGQDPEYSPTEYKITFTAPGSKSADYARDVMDAVLTNYISFYSEKYVEQRVLASAVVFSDDMEYDYLDTTKILEDSTAQLLTYLQEKMETYPAFRSSRTGYTFEDLNALLEHMYNYRIPDIYASILSASATQDKKLTIDKLTREMDVYDLRIRTYEEQIEKLKGIIESYCESNKAMLEYHFMNGKNTSTGTDYVLGQVYDNREAADVQTEYDALLEEYVSLRLQCEYARIDKAHAAALLSTFRRAGSGTRSSEELSGVFADYIRDLNAYYELVRTTASEVNEYLSANYLKTVSTIVVSTSINIKLYVMLAIVFFTVVGIFIAVVLGRSIDFIDYLLYTDKQTDMPNRTSCDRQIDELARKLLPEDFAFFEITLTSLAGLSSQYGRQTGDAVLRDFAAILKSFGENYGFVGYNGSGVFFAFFDACSCRKQQLIEKALLKNVDEYNVQHPGYEIEYNCTCSNTTEDEEYDIRALMRSCFAKSRKAQK